MTTVSMGDFPSIAVEAGFSEEYERLKRDMEQWLVGCSRKVCVLILVNLIEGLAFNGEPFTRPDNPAAAP